MANNLVVRTTLSDHDPLQPGYNSTSQTGAFLTTFRAISPLQAVELARKAGLTEPERLILDYAAAGLLKGYALVIETSAAEGERHVKRQAAVSKDLWRRVIHQEMGEAVWRGGTIRLKAVPTEGWPEVEITGVSFHPGSVRRLARHHDKAPIAHPDGGKLAPVPHVPQPASACSDRASERRDSEVHAIPPGAQTVTVKQAMAALGLGRTKVNQLMKEGRLVRVKFDRSTRITVASIKALADGASSKAED